MSDLARKQINEGYSTPLIDSVNPTVYHRVGHIMWLRNKNARGEMPDTHMEAFVKGQLDAYAAQREAQAVQREREAANGLVELAEHIIKMGGGYGYGALATTALATYNDNRKG